MNKHGYLVLALAMALLAPAKGLCADETKIAPVQSAEAPSPAPAPVETAPVAVEAAPAPATTVASAEESVPATAANENLEFVSGEVSTVDPVTKSVTVKLYGETENNTTDKTLTVSTDASTDITDGEKDRELTSLSAGTEVDVEYDPTTKKATYIFVY